MSDHEERDPWGWKLSGAGVYRSPHLDTGGFHWLVAVGANRRELEKVRVFKRDEEQYLAGYLRHEYGLDDADDKRCRECGRWFVYRSSRHVRCQQCRAARKDRQLDGGL